MMNDRSQKGKGKNKEDRRLDIGEGIRPSGYQGVDIGMSGAQALAINYLISVIRAIRG